jgi:hypothetical protein
LLVVVNMQSVVSNRAKLGSQTLTLSHGNNALVPCQQGVSADSAGRRHGVHGTARAAHAILDCTYIAHATDAPAFPIARRRWRAI